MTQTIISTGPELVKYAVTCCNHGVKSISGQKCHQIQIHPSFPNKGNFQGLPPYLIVKQVRSMFSYDFLTCFLHVFSVFISTYIYQSNEKDPRLTLQWYAGGMIVDNGVLEKKCQTPGKKKYILELEKHFKAPTVMWSPGPLVFYSFGVVLWSLGTLVL